MALRLLQNVAERAINTAGNAAGSAWNYLQKNAPEAFNQALNASLLSNPTTFGLTKQGQNTMANVGRTLQKTPDTSVAPPRPAQMLFKSTPLAPLFDNPATQAQDALYGLATSLPGEFVRSRGRTFERTNTPEGRQQIIEGGKQIPTQTKMLFTPGQRLEGLDALVNNPAIEDVLNLSDVLTLGAGSLAKSAGKETLEQGVEQAARTATKNIVEEGTERAGKTVLREASEKTPSLLKKGEKLVDTAVDSSRTAFGEVVPNLENQLAAQKYLQNGRTVSSKGDLLTDEQLALKALDEYRKATAINKSPEALNKAAKTESLFQKATTLSPQNTGNKVTRALRNMFLDTKSNLKRTFGTTYDEVISPVINKYENLMGNAVDFKRKYQEVLKNLPVKPGSADDKLVREFSKKGGEERVINAVGIEEANRLKGVYESLRSMYDEIFNTVNAARKEAGLGELPYKEDFLSQVGGKNKSMLDAVLEGGVETVDPVSETIFKKQGKNATTGAIESMTNYLELAGRAGFTDIGAKDIETVRKALSKQGASREALEQLSTLEKNILGTATEGNLEKAVNKYTGIIRQSAVVGKIGSLVNQFLAAPQGFIVANPIKAVKGNLSRKVNSLVKESNFLKTVGYSVPKELRTGNPYTKAIGIGGDALQKTQQFTNETIWKGFAQQALDNGLSEKEAVQFADEILPKIVGDRRLGMAPQFYNTLAGKIFGAFTLEPTAASTRFFTQLKNTPTSTKAIGEVIGTVIGWHYLNNFYERYVGGYRPYQDIPEAIMNSAEYLQGSDEKEKSNLKALGVLFSEALQSAPVIQNVFNTTYSLAGSKGVVSDSREVFGESDNTWMNVGTLYNPLDNAGRNITGNKWFDVPANIASNIFPFTDQALKTTQAGISLGKGYVESRAGNPLYNTPDNTLDKVRSLVFGQYATPEAQEYYNSDFSRPLTEKEQEVLATLPKDQRQAYIQTVQDKKRKDNRLESLFTKDLATLGAGGKTGGESSGTKQQILDHYFDGKTYKDNTRKGQREILDKMIDVMDDETIPQEQKDAIASAVGINQNDFEYYRTASMSQEDRLEGLLLFANAEHENRDDFIINLALGKRSVGGKSMFSTTMFDRLYDDGLISKDEKALLSAIKYDPIYNKFYMDRDYKGGSGGASESKIRSYVRSINALHKDTFKSNKAARAITQDISLPDPPTLKFPKAPKVSGGTSDRWFTPY